MSPALTYLVHAAYGGLLSGFSIFWMGPTQKELEAVKEELVKLLATSRMDRLADRHGRWEFFNGATIVFVRGVMTGASSEHVQLLIMDSPSRMNAQAVKEAAFVPSRMAGIGPITIRAET